MQPTFLCEDSIFNGIDIAESLYDILTIELSTQSIYDGNGLFR